MSEEKQQSTEEQEQVLNGSSENDKEEVKEAKENGTNEEASAEEKEPPKEMRAVVLTGFGGLKSVKIMKKPEPSPAEGEVLIRVKACGLNFQDLMIRQGAIDSLPKCPVILGFECAGEIEQIGEKVEGFKVGDRVVALPECRAWAELVAVPTDHVFPIPKEMGYLDAAAVTMNYTVAQILLFQLAQLSPGQSLLVHSVAGGVGLAVVQLARTIPDVTIFGVCSKSKHEAVRAANIPIDHLLERGCDYASEVRKICSEGVDIVLDCLCGEECNRGYGLLKPMGRYILYGSSNVVTGETKSFFSAARAWWQVDKVSPLKLFDDNRTISGFSLRRLMYHQNGTEYVRKAVQQVFEYFKEKKISPVVDSTWALEDVAEAMQKMHDRKNIGKLVLDPSMEPKPKPVTPAKSKKEDKKKQLSEEKKQDSEEKKDEKKDASEEKKEEAAITNGESAGDSDSKGKENSS